MDNHLNPSTFDISNSFSTLSVSSNSQIIFTVIFLIFWSILYAVVNYTCNFKSLSTKDANDVKNRIVSIVHGIASFWFASYEYLPYPVFKYTFYLFYQVNITPIYKLSLYCSLYLTVFTIC